MTALSRLADAAAIFILILALLPALEKMWKIEPNDDKRVNSLTVIFFMMLTAFALWRVRTFW